MKGHSKDRGKKKRKKLWCVLDITRVLYLFLSPKNEAGVPLVSFYIGECVIIEVLRLTTKTTKFNISEAMSVPVPKHSSTQLTSPSFPPRSPSNRSRTPPVSRSPDRSFRPVSSSNGWLLRCMGNYLDFVSWRDTIKGLPTSVQIIDNEGGIVAGEGGSLSLRNSSGKGSMGRKGGSLGKKGSMGRRGGTKIKDGGKVVGDMGKAIGRTTPEPVGFSRRVATVMEAGMGGTWWAGGGGGWGGAGGGGFVFLLIGDDVSRREFGLLCQKLKGYCKRAKSEEHQVFFYFLSSFPFLVLTSFSSSI